MHKGFLIAHVGFQAPNLIRNCSLEPCLEHLRLLRNLIGTDSGAERPIMLRTVWLKGGTVANDTFSERFNQLINKQFPPMKHSLFTIFTFFSIFYTSLTDTYRTFCKHLENIRLLTLTITGSRRGAKSWLF